jgi:exodeoxyribonuclease VII small subunit
MEMKKMTYEEAVAELGRIVEQVESPDVKLDRIKGLLQRANELVEFCRRELAGYGEEFSSIMEDKQI